MNKPKEIKGQGHSLTFAKGHSVSKFVFFILKLAELYETKNYIKSFWE